MQITQFIAGAAALLLIVGCGRNSNNAGATADTSSSSSDRSGSAPADNTGINARDRSDATLTPADQGASESDRDITRRIRRAITANEQLSTEAKNIKIITTNGKVTLRGPVNSEQEKKTIEGIVQQTGVSTLDDQLETKTTNQ